MTLQAPFQFELQQDGAHVTHRQVGGANQDVERHGCRPEKRQHAIRIGGFGMSHRRGGDDRRRDGRRARRRIGQKDVRHLIEFEIVDASSAVPVPKRSGDRRR